MDYVSAFVCEINEDSVKMFDWKQQLMEVKKTEFEDDIELGEFYEIDEYSDSRVFIKRPESLGPERETELKCFLKDGVVHTKVLAFAPNEASLELMDLRQYRNTAYSNLLQILGDPNDLFFDFPHSEVGLATVKYAPTDNYVFEVVDVEDVPDSYKEEIIPEHLVAMAPWNVIQNEKYVQEASKPREDSIRFFQNQPISATQEFIGVCIEKYVKENGDVLHNVYSPNLGMVHTKNSLSMKVGAWYAFRMNDNRRQKDRKEKYSTSGHYNSATIQGSNPNEIDQQLPTRVISCLSGEPINERKAKFRDWDKNFEEQIGKKKAKSGNLVECTVFTCSFLFKSEMFKPDENAHFHCPALGKVIIGREESKRILERIEASRELTSDDSKWKDNRITIEVDVIPYHSCVSIHTANPHAALFHVKEVLRMVWLIGGGSID